MARSEARKTVGIQPPSDSRASGGSCRSCPLVTPSLPVSPASFPQHRGRPPQRGRLHHRVGIREAVHLIALKRLGSLASLQEATKARIKKGQHDSDGFKFLPEGGFSIQGVDANAAWEHTLQLADKIGIRLQLRIEWRDKPDAAHPGKTGVLTFEPQPPK